MRLDMETVRSGGCGEQKAVQAVSRFSSNLQAILEQFAQLTVAVSTAVTECAPCVANASVQAFWSEFFELDASARFCRVFPVLETFTNSIK